MKYHGVSLRSYIHKNIIDRKLVLELLTQLVTQVKALNDLQYVHRDICLDNIVLRHNSKGFLKVTLIDFNSAVLGE